MESNDTKILVCDVVYDNKHEYTGRSNAKFNGNVQFSVKG